MSIKTYLGDSVYVEFDGYDIILTTDNGNGPSNTIVLEPQVLTAFQRFTESLTARVVEAQEREAKKSTCQHCGVVFDGEKFPVHICKD